MTKNLLTFLTTLSLLTSAQAFAHKNGKGEHKEMNKEWPCSAEIKSLCGSLKMDDHEGTKKCLDDNADKLSDKCKAGRAKMQAEMKGYNEACGEDMKTLCADVPSGDFPAMHECMRKNDEKISDKCRVQKEKMSLKWEHHKKMHGGNDKSDTKDTTNAEPKAKAKE